MKLEDLKFRYIIPLDEVNERGEPGYMIDAGRLKDRHNDCYDRASVGEAELFLMASAGKLDNIIKEIPNVLKYDFPDGTDEKEKVVAVYVAKERLSTDDGIQNAINTYFKGRPIDKKADTLEKHYGFPW